MSSEGALWLKQRKLVSNAFRLEILDDIIGVSARAVERLVCSAAASPTCSPTHWPPQCAKLERAAAAGKPVELAEELRMLTLQVIGEAILSLSPEESDRVFPHLYLPIMEEGNRRSLEPWRSYLPTPAWFRQRRNVRKLNAYIGGAPRRACGRSASVHTALLQACSRLAGRDGLLASFRCALTGERVRGKSFHLSSLRLTRTADTARHG